MSDFLLRLLKDPWGSAKRAFLKIFVLPIKYGRGQDYNAAGYWKDRFQRYSTAMKGVGCEGLSEEDNLRAREQAIKIFDAVCRAQNIRFDQINILEIGCGNGFYTNYLRQNGARSYTGVDITDVLFGQLRAKFPGYNFVRKDVTADSLEGQFDLIVMMDVIQHVVNREKLLFALGHIRGCLRSNGIFIVAPITASSKRHLFHVHRWSVNELDLVFQAGYSRQIVPFRVGEDLVVVRNSGVGSGAVK